MTQVAAGLRSHEWSETGIAVLQSLPPWIVAAGVGLLLLFFGRKLYWLLLGAVGFALGFGLLAQFVATSTSWAPWLAGLVGGLAGVIAAFFVQGALLAVVGALLGAICALLAMSMWGSVPPEVLIVVAIVGAVLGAIVLRKVFFAAVIVATALAGSGILMETFTQVMVQQAGTEMPGWLWNVVAPGPGRTILFVGVGALGILYQSTRSGKDQAGLRKRKRRLKEDVRRLERARSAATE